ncbi:HD domain-containing protein [Knoellia subterranea]|uniref:Metal-dependent phosphohydrolase n=1 Tax=Knoellia subterranea KCTC 19937 TaxID=1385521 RepID=A0A0A0JGV1_9MICO|nr:hypothetical protein [Knoellia subterranea]KGN36635.1 hypothetical protein N803_04055 [Knoellia subterranea KCTC 19937]
MKRDAQWDEAVHEVRGDLHGLVSTHEDLVRRWSEPHRGYHDLQHLDEVIDALDELRGTAIDLDQDWAATVFAAWFHDAVYDPATPSDNERLSAELAREALSQNGIEESAVDLVVALVDATVAHDVLETRGPLAAFHDADLWILSAPVDRFDRYCADVRQEYVVVPDDAYASGRSAILEPFLARDTIYRTAWARQHWEPRARTNLSRELSRLRG